MFTTAFSAAACNRLTQDRTTFVRHEGQSLFAAANEVKVQAAGLLSRAGTAVTAPFSPVNNSLASQAPVSNPHLISSTPCTPYCCIVFYRITGV